LALLAAPATRGSAAAAVVLGHVFVTAGLECLSARLFVVRLLVMHGALPRRLEQEARLAGTGDVKGGEARLLVALDACAGALVAQVALLV
jgi:hypothetical protein